MTRRFVVAAAAIPLAFALGAIASHLLFPAFAVPARALLQPVLVVTGWGGSGVAAWLVLLATLGAATSAYVIAVRETISAGRVSLPFVLAAGLAAALGALFFRFVFSSDLYAYAAYGALAASGQSPYHAHNMAHTALLTPAFSDAIGFEWLSLPACAYGPAFVWFARALVAVTNGDLSTLLLAFRFVAIAAFVAAVALAARTARLAVVIGLNPVVIWSVAEGHNDALAFAVAALGAAIGLARPALGGAVAALSATIKATGGLAALAFAYGISQRRVWIGLGAGLFLAAILQLAAYSDGTGFRFSAEQHSPIADALRDLIALAILAVVFVRRRGDDRARLLAALALVVWVALPQIYPWYGIWLLPLAALTLRTSEGPALLAATFCCVVRYLPDALGTLQFAPWLNLAAAAVPAVVFFGKEKALTT